MNDWWQDDPSERYWIVSTDHDGRAHPLIAWRQLDGVTKPPWHHSLIMHVKPGDRVFHYWSSASLEKRQSIVAYSTVAADPQESEYSERILGNDPNAMLRHPPGTPAFIAALCDWTCLEEALELQQIQKHAAALLVVRDQIRKQSRGSAYFPWAFNDHTQQLRPTQAYLMKLPDRARQLLGLPALP